MAIPIMGKFLEKSDFIIFYKNTNFSVDESLGIDSISIIRVDCIVVSKAMVELSENPILVLLSSRSI